MRIQKAIARYHIFFLSASRSACSVCSAFNFVSHSAFNFLRKVVTKMHAGMVTL